MPLCDKCHQKEATVHIAAFVNGRQEEAVHLCTDCAEPMGMKTLDHEQLARMSIIGKKCEFCGKEASSGEFITKDNAIHWCFDCGLELFQIVAGLMVAERPDLMEASAAQTSVLSLFCDAKLRAVSTAMLQKAAQQLRDRRRQNGCENGNEQ